MIDTRKIKAEIADLRHNQLKQALKDISVSLEKADSNVVTAIKDQVVVIKELVKSIQDMPQPEAPKVDVEVNQEEVITSIKKICDDILESNNKVIDALENRKMPESFTLVKTIAGITESVKVNYKPANQLNS
jgi:hypothetical protein